jgi:hypothetical protein
MVLLQEVKSVEGARKKEKRGIEMEAKVFVLDADKRKLY